MNKRLFFSYLSFAILAGFIYWNYTIYATANVKFDSNILSFKFETKNNAVLNNEVEGEINEPIGAILLNIPKGIDLKSLEPTITFNSNKYSYLPQGPHDFTNPVIYTITDHNGIETEYKVIAGPINYQSRSSKNYWRYLIRYLKKL